MAQNLQSLSAVFGSPEMTSIAGNIGGAMLGQYMANKQMDKQLANQKELQRQAFELNQQAVKQQAQNEVVGLKNAGLNPALADGSGAPSVPAGSASVGNVPTLGNIFEGVAEIVQAAKMPTDIANTEANTANTKTNTAATQQQIDFFVPKVLEKMDKDIESLVQSIRGSKNLNDAFEAQDKFLRDQGKVIFDRMRTQLQEKGMYDSLAPDTQKTLDDLAEGSISVGQGEYDALIKAIDVQSKLSDADRRLIDNAFANNLTSRQFMDKGVMNALTKAPQDLRNKLYKEIDHYSAEIAGIMQDIKVGKAEVALKKAQTLRTNFERESAELNDVKWLAKQGRFDDVDVRTDEMALENVNKRIDDLLHLAEMMAAARLAGTSARPRENPETKPRPVIIAPNEGQMIRSHNSRSDPKNLDKYLNWK